MSESDCAVKQGATWEIYFTLYDLDSTPAAPKLLDLSTLDEIEFRISTMDRKTLIAKATLTGDGVSIVGAAANGYGKARFEAEVTTYVTPGPYRQEVFILTADAFSEPLIDGILTVGPSLKVQTP